MRYIKILLFFLVFLFLMFLIHIFFFTYKFHKKFDKNSLTQLFHDQAIDASNLTKRPDMFTLNENLNLLSSIAVLLTKYDIFTTPEELDNVINIDPKKTDDLEIVRFVCDDHGFDYKKSSNVTLEDLKKMNPPLLGKSTNGHYFTILNINSKYIDLYYTQVPQKYIRLDLDFFLQAWDRSIIIFKTRTLGREIFFFE